MMATPQPFHAPVPLAPTSLGTVVPESKATITATISSGGMTANANTNKRRPATNKKVGGGAVDSVPLFLRKTFDLVENADPEIASWSEDGTAFVVKDVKRFTDDVIPSYFKHNNFSSFVRQLNFYGFRKVKDDNLKITHEPTVEDKYWRFRHPYFRRGRLDLLIEIKKASQPEVAEKQEVNALKTEVKTLKNQLASMAKNMEALTRVVHDLMQKDEQRQVEERERLQQQRLEKERQNYASFDPVGSANKKRRISTYDEQPTSVTRSSAVEVSSPVRSSSQPPSTSDWGSATQDTTAGVQPMDVSSSESQAETHSTHPPLPPKAKMLDVDHSIGSLGELDDELLATLMALDDDDRVAVCTKDLSTPDTHISLPDSNKFDAPDPKLVERLRSSLASLPKNMQELFVERLVKALASPEAFQDQVEAVNALAAAAAAEAQQRLQNGTDHAGDLMEALDHQQKVELATAVLGSFLARYGSAIPTEEPTTLANEEVNFSSQQG